MANNSQNQEDKDMKTTFKFSSAFIVFGIIIAIIAIIFFTIGCSGPHPHNKTIEDGIGNAYATSNQVMDDYILAATTAEKQNLPKIAVLFRAAATMELVHSNQLKKLYPQYSDGKVSLDQIDSAKYSKRYTDGITPAILNDSTKTNLAFFLGKQSYLVDTFYETLMKQATMFDNPEMYKYYGWFFRSEQSAFRLYSDALKNYNESYLFTDKYSVCPLCGNIYIFGDGIDVCTVCGVPANTWCAFSQ